MTDRKNAPIAPPRWPPNDRDRLVECPLALEQAFQGLVEAAEEAGWSGDEIAYALLHLASANLKARSDNAHTTAAIARARRESLKRTGRG